VSYFDSDAADRAQTFFERYLTHSKGELAGQPFIPATWQLDRIIRPLFGWKDDDGQRLIRTVYCELGRGSGKTTLAAGIALYLLFADMEPGAEIYSAAVDASQAAISFDIAKAMVMASPALRKRCKVYRRSIVVPSTNSVYKVITSEAKSKHGFNSHGIIFDEVAQQPDRELWDTLHTSTGKRRQPIEFLVTTAGVYDPQSIGWELHDYAIRVRDGAIEDPSFLPVIYAADAEDDIQSPDTWRKANPNYPISPTHPYMARESKKASELPSYGNTFLRLQLGIWTQQVTRWLSLEDWHACKLDALPDLSGLPSVAGLDLSTTTDISALVLAFQMPDDRIFLLPRFFVPEAKLTNTRDKAPYARWAKDGHLTTTPGNVIDYSFIRSEILSLAEQYGIEEIRYDPYNATQLCTQLAEDDGFTMTQMRQGYLSMSPPAKELERRIMSRTIAHDGNPVLDWMIGNVAIRSDPAGNIKPDKAKSTARIDGVAASVIAISGIMAGDGGSVYEHRGIISL
jgi:phage terminase large subunit-like protein